MNVKNHRSFFFRIFTMLTCLVLLPLSVAIIISMWLNMRTVNQELSHSMDTSVYYLETLSTNTTESAIKDIKAAFIDSRVEAFFLARNYPDAEIQIRSIANYCRTINKNETVSTDIGFFNAEVGYINAVGLHNSSSMLFDEKLDWYRSSFSNSHYTQYRYMLYQSDDQAYMVIVWPFISVKTHACAIMYSINLDSLFQ